MAEKVVLAYSGGLDTSVAIKWLQEQYGLHIVTLTADLGGEDNMTRVKDKALAVGAVAAYVEDARQEFVEEYVWPALQANAMYQNAYPLATALGRPLIAKLMVKIARKEGASAVAHGCTGKGNDQVRIEVSVGALAPDLRVIAPAREWDMTDRAVEIEYAKKHGIPVPATIDRPYSIDANLWGKSIEGGVLEDPWREPPGDVYGWTCPIQDTPEEAGYVTIGFARGVPDTLDGEPCDGVTLLERLNRLGGEHGVGRIDHVEDRLVGIKSREIYEAPAALILIQAHRALESLTLTRDQLRFKAGVSREYSDLVYNGLWFSGLREDLAAYVRSTQRRVNGVVRVMLHKGTATVVGRKATASLYDAALSTYGEEDAFDHSAAEGFIKVWGLPSRTQAQAQGHAPEEETPPS